MRLLLAGWGGLWVACSLWVVVPLGWRRAGVGETRDGADGRAERVSSVWTAV